MINRSLFLTLLAFVCLSAAVFAQKPNISYQIPKKLYIGKEITPAKVANTGGAVPDKLFPYVSQYLRSSTFVTRFLQRPSGDIYGALSRTVRHIKPDGSSEILAGGFEAGYVDDTGEAARFGDITDIASDAEGNIYVTEDNYRDGLNSRVRKITPAGVVTTYARGLRAPQGIAVDANGIVYVAEAAGRIAKIAKDGTVTAFAGKYGGGNKDGAGANASFNEPKGLNIDKSGNLYVADRGNRLIRKITPLGVVTTIAGSGKNETKDGIGTAASFLSPDYVQIDSKGNIIVSENGGLLRKISVDGEVNTIAGTVYDADGNIFYGQLSTNVIVGADDNIIALVVNGSGSGIFYKMYTTGFNVYPQLPQGVKLSGNGTISGTPSELVYPGKYKVTASNSSGFSSAILDLEVGISSDPPVVTSFSPKAFYPDAAITITGNFFTDATKVSIGGIVASFHIDLPTQITVWVPRKLVAGNIVITTPRGKTSVSGYEVIPPPTITAVSPLSGSQGDKITITGTDLLGAKYVTFGGYTSDFKVISSTQVEATLGNGRSGYIYLATSGGEAGFPGFTYIGPPAISAINPSIAGAGTTVTIDGQDIYNATSVKFGAVEASSFKVVSKTRITAVVAPGSSNGITITTPAGRVNYYDFQFIPPPLITQVYPLKGGYNTTININGNFLSNAKVTIGGVPALVDYSNPFQISAKVGGGAASGDVVVETNAGITKFPGFVWVDVPKITSFTPATASAGDKITITGTNLAEVDYVSIGGINAVFKVISPTSIEATVGFGASGDIQVMSEGGTASQAGFIHKGPVISSFSPLNAGTGQTVVIKGSNFTNVTGVSFGGVQATSYTVTSPTEISAVVGSGRTGYVSVTTAAGQAYASGFVHPGPQIYSVTPLYWGALSTSPITISGINFTGTTKVNFSGVPAASFTLVSPTTITATPAATVSGDVEVITPAGSDKVAGFVWANAPTISAITPSSQNSSGSVKITGTGFYGVTGITFGGVRAYYFYAESPTSVVAYVGSGASGDVAISTIGGTGKISGFTYTSPIITAIAPATAAAGQTVTISGKNLSAIKSVKFGYTDAASFSVISDEKITAVVGSGASGDVMINSQNESAVFAGFTFVGQPVIYGCSPAEGGNGTIVTISGDNLQSTSEVKFGGVAATIIKAEANRVTAQVGSGATGKVWLKTVAGTAEFDSFTWYKAPVISSASPLKASASTLVTITGSNFAGIDEVKFGNTNVVFTVVSPTKITATPMYGSSGDITIIGKGGTVKLPGFVFIEAPVIRGFNKKGDGPDATVTIEGYKFDEVKEVKFGGVPAKSFTVTGDSIITAKPGIGATGFISVTAVGGTATARGFLYRKPPVISSFSPASGPVGTMVTILGDNFNDAIEKNVVFVGPVKAKIKSASKTRLEVEMPSGGNNPIMVLNTDTRLLANTNSPFLIINKTNEVKYSNKLEVKINYSPGTYVFHDLNNDNKPELLVANEDSLYVLMYGSDPDLSKSSFTQKIPLITNRQISSLAVGDLDGDGKKDVLVSTIPSIVLLHNTSTGNEISFEQKTLEYMDGITEGMMTLRDIDADGRLDLLTSGLPLYYPNSTTSEGISFGRSVLLRPEGSSVNISYSLADIDGDTKPDALGGSSYVGITLYKNNSVPGTFYESDFHPYSFPSTGYARDIATGDFDGDGKPDVVYSDTFSDNSFYALRNTADIGVVNGSTFAPVKQFSLGAITYPFIVADMDGDGKLDLLSASNDDMHYARNQSTPGNVDFAGTVMVLKGAAIYGNFHQVANDVDGDGHMDIVMPDNDKNQLYIYHNGPQVVPQIIKASTLAAGTGTKITLTGKHLDGVTEVKFGSKKAQSFTVLAHDTVEVIVGDGETGAITIKTPNGIASLAGFTYIGAPVIGSAVALTDGSGVLKITGRNFAKVKSVAINGTQASSFTIKSDTTITATFAGIRGELVVTSDGGSGKLTNVTVKANLVISFGIIPAHTYGDADFNLTATSNNANLPILYSTNVADVITIKDGKAQIIKAGNVTITATQAGDELNSTAGAVMQTYIVSKKALQVTANDQNRSFGKANPDFTLLYSGFVNGDDELKLKTPPVASTTANQISAAGVYDITVNGGTDDNYSFTYINGKLIVTTAVTNFRVASGSVTCRGENNGSITINAAQQANYTAVTTGNGVNRTDNFKTELNIDKLSPGKYNVCISDAALPGQNQCFDLVITEPKDLSVFSVVNKEAGTLRLALDGGSTYNINLNGKTYVTSDNAITLPLNKIANTLSVTTDKACQGIVQRIIDLSTATTPYPNPFTSVVHLNLGEQIVEKAVVKVYDLKSGSLKHSEEFRNQSGVITVDLSSLSEGVYALNLIINNKKLVYKIIKQ